MAYILIQALALFYKVLCGAIVLRACLSWFIPYPPYGNKLYDLLMSVTEPLLAPARRILSRFQGGMRIDFSPILALLFLYVIYRILVVVVITVFYGGGALGGAAEAVTSSLGYLV